MSQFFVTLEASAVFSLDVPTIEVLVAGVVVSSASVTAHTGVGTDTLSFSLDFSGNYPSSLSFRFNDGLSEPGRSITIHNAYVNGYNITSDLTATVYSLMQSGAFDTATFDHLFGRVTPTTGDLPAPTVTDAPGVSNPNLRGTSGNDVIDASDGDDRVWGEDGNDVLIGGAGQNTLFGGAGNDLILGGTGNDVIWGQDGDDLLYGGTGDDLLLGGLGSNVLNGGDGLDALIGDSGSDILYGEAGGDILLGEAGADFLYGDAGIDYLVGDTGNDTIYGGADTDYISGGGNNDTIYGEDGDDFIDGGGGADTVDGGVGSDDIMGGSGNDVLSGGTDADYILGDAGGDTLNGDSGNDGLLGGTGADTLNGGDGNDALYGHTLDSLTASTIVVSDSSVFFNMYTGSFYKYVAGTVNYATAQASAAAATLNGVGGHLVTITSATENTYVEALAAGATVWLGASDATNEGDWRWLYGVESGLQFWTGTSTGSAVNSMYTNWNTGEPNDLGGSDAAAMLSGGVWADQTTATLNGYIIEWEGSLWNDDSLIDTINGGVGDDLLYGAGGNDILSGDNDSDKIWGGAGDDTINGGNGNDALFGDAGGDTISGGAGDDVIDGGAGNDTLDGGADTDTLTYGLATSGVTVNLATATAQNTGGAGTDTISNFENLMGSAYNDTLEGTSGNNVLTGGAGTDTVTYTNAGSAVTVSLTANTATGGAGNDTLATIENVVGSAYNDSLTGSTGTNILQGGAGVDTVTSGTSDTLAAPIAAILAANAGVVWNSTTGNFYKFVNSSVTWSVANAAATGAGNQINGVAGHLAHVTSSAENTYVQTTLGAGSSLWIGQIDRTTEGTWVYSGGVLDGIIFYSGGVSQNNFYNAWKAGEPSAGGASKDYIMMNGGSQWESKNSTTAIKYVIEWEGTQLLTPTASNTLSGGTGADTLVGGAGQDIFWFEAGTSGTSDTITGYDRADLDKLDISDLLSGYVAGTSDDDLFARFTVSGANLLLQIDADGATGGSSYTTIATLSGLGTSGLNVEEMVAQNLLVMS